MLATFTPEALPPHAASLARMCASRSGLVATHPEQEIGPVRIVIAGDELLCQTTLLVVPGRVEEQVHRAARGLEVGVAAAILVAAPGVVEVRKIELVDALVFGEPEQRGQVGGVVLGHGEAQTDLDAPIAAQAQASERGIEGAVPCAGSDRASPAFRPG